MFHMILPQSDFLNYSQSNKCLPQRYSRQGFNSSSDNAGQSGCGMRAMCCWLPVTADQKFKTSRPKESWNQNGKSISRIFFGNHIGTNLNTYLSKTKFNEIDFKNFISQVFFVLAHFFRFPGPLCQWWCQMVRPRNGYPIVVTWHGVNYLEIRSNGSSKLDPIWNVRE